MRLLAYSDRMTSADSRKALLSLVELRSLVESGRIDTVVLGICDMQGRLQGKRCDATYFLDDVVAHHAEACNYLLAVDVDMRTVDGYEISSWEKGYGDFVMRPDLSTIRPLPWHPGSALCIADVEWENGAPVSPAPRHVLRSQLDRLAALGYTALVGTELEFVAFRDTYEEAWRKGYRDLVPANLYNVDYSLLGTGRVESLLRRIRTEMARAGLEPESSKGECNLGQHEVAFRYADALTTSDNHVLYKLGAKEIAAQEGMSLSFMAKIDEREGNSCHIHLSLRDASGDPVLAGDRPGGVSELFEHFVAGMLATVPELTLLFAPNVNSYKRFAAGSFAPTSLAWGRDNRTCAIRVVGHGPSLRVENRIPGGDVNPYLAIAAMVAGGLHGLEHEMGLEPPTTGNAYHAGGSRQLPGTLRDAADLFEKSSLARDALGDDVVDHYCNMARVELEAFDRAVTDWERIRGFERM